MISPRRVLEWAERKLARSVPGQRPQRDAPLRPAPPTAFSPPPENPGAAPSGAPSEETKERTGTASEPDREAVIEALRTVYDPEIPVNIYELGLIYDLRLPGQGAVEIDMTLTAPGCPVAEDMPDMVKEAVEIVPGVRSVKVELVWDPPWDPSRMSEIARLETGMF
jgi:FeS assembly SUF system protein